MTERIRKILAEPIKVVQEREKEMTEDEIQDVEVTCCNVEITQVIKDNGRCPKCLENL